jgi:hypothetical protein
MAESIPVIIDRTEIRAKTMKAVLSAVKNVIGDYPSKSIWSQSCNMNVDQINKLSELSADLSVVIEEILKQNIPENNKVFEEVFPESKNIPASAYSYYLNNTKYVDGLNRSLIFSLERIKNSNVQVLIEYGNSDTGQGNGKEEIGFIVTEGEPINVLMLQNVKCTKELALLDIVRLCRFKIKNNPDSPLETLYEHKNYRSVPK